MSSPSFSRGRLLECDCGASPNQFIGLWYPPPPSRLFPGGDSESVCPGWILSPIWLYCHLGPTKGGSRIVVRYSSSSFTDSLSVSVPLLYGDKPRPFVRTDFPFTLVLVTLFGRPLGRGCDSSSVSSVDDLIELHLRDFQCNQWSFEVRSSWDLMGRVEGCDYWVIFLHVKIRVCDSWSQGYQEVTYRA